MTFLGIIVYMAAMYSSMLLPENMRYPALAVYVLFAVIYNLFCLRIWRKMREGAVHFWNGFFGYIIGCLVLNSVYSRYRLTGRRGGLSGFIYWVYVILFTLGGTGFLVYVIQLQLGVAA